MPARVIRINIFVTLHPRTANPILAPKDGLMSVPVIREKLFIIIHPRSAAPRLVQPARKISIRIICIAVPVIIQPSSIIPCLIHMFGWFAIRIGNDTVQHRIHPHTTTPRLGEINSDLSIGKDCFFEQMRFWKACNFSNKSVVPCKHDRHRAHWDSNREFLSGQNPEMFRSVCSLPARNKRSMLR